MATSKKAAPKKAAVKKNPEKGAGKNSPEQKLEDQQLHDEDLNTSPKNITDDSVKVIDIRKAKLKQDLFMEVLYNERLKDEINEYTRTSNAPVHDDLQKVLKKLNVHLCNVCDQADESKVFCTGFSIGSANDGVCLMGYLLLSTGQHMNLVSPFIRYTDAYSMSPQGTKMMVILDNLKHEVKRYLFEGHHAPKAQQELDFVGGDGGDKIEE